MNIVAFAPAFNTNGRKDATGAFQPEATAFCKQNKNGVVILVDNRRDGPSMRTQVIDAIRQSSPRPAWMKAVAFFCHGLGRKIQFGFDVRNVDELAKAINDSCDAGTAGVRVVLYACNTGMASLGEQYKPVGGDGGFADALRDALCRSGMTTCQVDAHTTAGHTTRNPYVRRFEGHGSPVGGVGGYILVAPGSKLWRPWVKALRETDLRHEFPFLTAGEIHQRLLGAS